MQETAPRPLHLSALYAGPLCRLDIDRFIEIPDSVSCFAGVLAVSTDIPYLTIRAQKKTGRVSDSRVIGHPSEGESVVIVDDVIADGRSKIATIRACADL